MVAAVCAQISDAAMHEAFKKVRASNSHSLRILDFPLRAMWTSKLHCFQCIMQLAARRLPHHPCIGFKMKNAIGKT
jgi:hypothetical protein